MEGNFVVFKTELFRSDQPDDEIDQWFLGEDCAQWLHRNLLSVPGVTPGVLPLEVDWGGWTFGIRADEVWFWINIWGGLEERGSWIVGIEPRPGVFGMFRKQRVRLANSKVSDAIDLILASDSEVTNRQWHEKHARE
jgi:hypothetical protein